MPRPKFDDEWEAEREAEVVALRARVVAAETALAAARPVVDAAKAWALTYGPRADDTVITESVKNERRLELYFAVSDLLDVPDQPVRPPFGVDTGTVPLSQAELRHKADGPDQPDPER